MVGIFTLFGATLIFFTAYHEGHRIGVSEGENEAYSWQSDKQIEDTCLGLNPVPRQECIARIVEDTKDYQRDSEDLAAQSSMALSTFWMMIDSILMTLATVLGVYYLWRTIEEMKDTNSYAMQTAEATSIATDLIREEKRPWLRIVSVTLIAPAVVKKDMVSANVMIAVENAGKRPAINVGFETIGCQSDFPMSHIIDNVLTSVMDTARKRSKEPENFTMAFPGETVKIRKYLRYKFADFPRSIDSSPFGMRCGFPNWIGVLHYNETFGGKMMTTATRLYAGHGDKNYLEIDESNLPKDEVKITTISLPVRPT